MKTLIKKIKDSGGTPLLVGGAVIDNILGRQINDFDIEVHGLPLSKIEEILEELGLRADTVGKAFGIIKTRIEDLDIDLSVPRRENKIGKGHKEFSVSLDHEMTPHEAARRRDLTINSMYKDLITGEIIDPFCGKNDLLNGVIRATDRTTFVEDPLRVLRIMQLLPRKGKFVERETVELCQSIVDEFETIPPERVFEEFNKLLMKPEKPSMGLRFLVDCGWIKHFPELEALIGCEQHPAWHPEGDVWEHTCLVIDHAAKLRSSLPEEWQLPFMFGALLHDVGKPSTSFVEEDGTITSNGHDAAGAPIAEQFMERITNNKTLIERTVAVAKNHMRSGQLYRDGAKISGWKRLHNALRLDVCAAMSESDSCSRPSSKSQHMPSIIAREYFEKFGEKPIEPALMGRHLIQLGIEPGPIFGKVLKEAYEMQIETGITDPQKLIEMPEINRLLSQ